MMTDEDLQARLTAAFREQAGPLAAQPVRATGLYRRAVRSRRRRRVAAAVSAAAAVALVTGLVAAAPWASSTGAPAAAGGNAAMPKYYVTVDRAQPVARIYASATGRKLGQVRLPGIDENADQGAIAAAADDGTFALALGNPQRFYRLRLAAGGRSGQVSPLDVPPMTKFQYVTGMALSPDGRMLAVSIEHTGRPAAVEIVSLATGAVRTWSSRGGQSWQLSWAGGDRELAFFWASPSGQSAAGLRLLHPASPGHSLLAAPIILPQQLGGDQVQSAVITPDGRSVIASVLRARIRRVSMNTITGGLIELPVRASGPPRTLLTLHPQRSAHRVSIGSCAISSVDPSGQHILGGCNQWGRFDHGKFTELPDVTGLPNGPTAAAW